MNNLQVARLVALTLILCLSAVSCKKGRVGVTPLRDGTSYVSQGGGGQRANIIDDGVAIGGDDQIIDSVDDWNPGNLPERPPDGTYTEDRDTLLGYTIYFEFDQSVVKANDIGKVEAVADYLKANPSEYLKIEGHCDERGTEEYNRALGERRALSPREALINMGISPDRMSTLSLGEDMPSVFGATEEAYAQNRRAEFVVLR